MSRQTSIFISHAWGGLSDEILAQLVKRLEAEDIHFILDKRDLSYRQNIKDFMVQLGDADMVIIILSDKYLKSEYCMFELLEIHKSENLTDRIFPIVLDEVKIANSSDRIEYVKYWETQLLNLQNKVKELNSLSYIEGITDDLNLYTEIRNNIARLTGILKDINTLTIKLHQESDYSDLVTAIKQQINGQRESIWKSTSSDPKKTSILKSVTFKRTIILVFALFGLFMAWGILTKSKALAHEEEAVNDSVSKVDSSTLRSNPNIVKDTANEISNTTSSTNTDPQVGQMVEPPSTKGNVITGKANPAKPKAIPAKPSGGTSSVKEPAPPSNSAKEQIPVREELTPVHQKPSQTTTILKGTELLARSSSTISSDDGFTPPKKIQFLLDKAIFNGGNMVLPAGSIISAKITNLKASNHSRAGVLDFVFEYVQTPAGQRIPLQATEFHLVAKGSNPMEITSQSIYKIKTTSTTQINY